jgi:hypothetical protein
MKSVSPEDGDSMFLRNVYIHLRVYTVSQRRRTATVFSPSRYLLLRNFGHYGKIFMNVCCYNRCHGNAVKGFLALCLLSICWLDGDHMLLRVFGPCEIIFMYMCIYVCVYLLKSVYFTKGHCLCLRKVCHRSQHKIDRLYFRFSRHSWRVIYCHGF